ncbi:MAG: NAD(P)(+) transhydrogenase (Re/Si-specific) subunit beta [Flavobacteriaceae bacterium]|nr:NAD(P)(+) transhydrogenase (Re/Si-specific) subunit beta [Flavobacteriaceae bacterium]
MSTALALIYLLSTVSFVVGLRLLGHPATANKGNRLAAGGMGLAILSTLFLHELEVPVKIYLLIGGAILLGGIVGALMAVNVKMTKMPELVSLFNGFGGASAALIGLVEFGKGAGDPQTAATITAGVVIGSLTFSGSLVAWGKLDGRVKSTVFIPQRNIINNLVLVGSIVLAVLLALGVVQDPVWIYVLVAAGLLYGILFVLPIGGADMPVVISLLNSMTGIAAAITGVLYSNKLMLIGGILVGSAGLILTFAMCRAMNRTLIAVVFGAFGEEAQAGGEARTVGGTVRKTTASDAAILLNYAKDVVIVPGYGLAVAQAQHVIHELEQLLTERGVVIRYAIHPVAGRMPGHMNVLLAESQVDYGLLVEMDDINPHFPQTDVVLVVGANDVVNPAAHNDPASPIYGMPILEVEHAKNIIVNKRSMNVGYAGIDNELFYNSKTAMLFGDAKAALTDLVAELKKL